jgi:hypothetical protein
MGGPRSRILEAKVAEALEAFGLTDQSAKVDFFRVEFGNEQVTLEIKISKGLWNTSDDH